MTDHPTHHFHPTEEGVLCHDCDARPNRAPRPCPAFLDEAKTAHAATARLLLRSLPASPTPPAADASALVHRAWDQAVIEWQSELNVREALCRSLGRLLEIEVDGEATLHMMSKP